MSSNNLLLGLVFVFMTLLALFLDPGIGRFLICEVSVELNEGSLLGSSDDLIS